MGSRNSLKIKRIFSNLLIEQLVGQESYIAVGVQNRQNIVHMAVFFLIPPFLFIIPVDGVDGMGFVILSLLLVKQKFAFSKKTILFRFRKNSPSVFQEELNRRKVQQ